jgi:hypothetical protein
VFGVGRGVVVVVVVAVLKCVAARVVMEGQGEKR